LAVGSSEKNSSQLEQNPSSLSAINHQLSANSQQLTACHLLPILLPQDSDRQTFISHLKAAGIQTSLHYPPIHCFSYYQELHAGLSLPVTEDYARREVTLPLYPGMTDEMGVLLTGWLYQRIAKKKPHPLALGILVLFVFLFPPTIRLLILGQAGAILAAALTAGALALEKRRLALSGFFFALALAKPQLGLLVLPSAVGYLLICQRDWRAAAKLAAFILCFSFALTIPLWLGSSDWAAHFLANLLRNHQWYQPSIYSQLTLHFGSTGQTMWFFLFSLALGLSTWLWTKYGPTQAVLWSLALTTFVSPYVWSWDFVLLLPLSIDTGIRSGSRLARLTLVIAYGLCFVLTILSQRLPGADDSALWWFPFVMMSGIILSRQLDRKYGSQGKALFAVV
jgi:hypothetical protein